MIINELYIIFKLNINIHTVCVYLKKNKKEFIFKQKASYVIFLYQIFLV